MEGGTCRPEPPPGRCDPQGVLQSHLWRNVQLWRRRRYLLSPGASLPCLTVGSRECAHLESRTGHSPDSRSRAESALCWGLSKATSLMQLFPPPGSRLQESLLFTAWHLAGRCPWTTFRRSSVTVAPGRGCTSDSICDRQTVRWEFSQGAGKNCRGEILR